MPWFDLKRQNWFTLKHDAEILETVGINVKSDVKISSENARKLITNVKACNCWSSNAHLCTSSLITIQ